MLRLPMRRLRWVGLGAQNTRFVEANSNAMAAVRNMIGDLLAEGARTGDIRDDVAPGELATYCLHALTAASSLPSKAAVRRLVEVTLAGLHPRA
jgi:hypothetical protein